MKLVVWCCIILYEVVVDAFNVIVNSAKQPPGYASVLSTLMFPLYDLIVILSITIFHYTASVYLKRVFLKSFEVFPTEKLVERCSWSYQKLSLEAFQLNVVKHLNGLMLLITA